MEPLLRRALTSVWLAFLLALAPVAVPGMHAQDIGSNPASPTIKVQSADSEKTKFQWKSALVDASLFLGVEHTFRLATDPQVRDGLRGPFFRDYADSVRRICFCWSDGDPFAVAYLGHPAQGAVASAISRSGSRHVASILEEPAESDGL